MGMHTVCIKGHDSGARLLRGVGRCQGSYHAVDLRSAICEWSTLSSAARWHYKSYLGDIVLQEGLHSTNIEQLYRLQEHRAVQCELPTAPVPGHCLMQ